MNSKKASIQSEWRKWKGEGVINHKYMYMHFLAINWYLQYILTLHYSARIQFALNTSKWSTVTFCFDRFLCKQLICIPEISPDSLLPSWNIPNYQFSEGYCVVFFIYTKYINDEECLWFLYIEWRVIAKLYMYILSLANFVFIFCCFIWYRIFFCQFL